LRPFFLIWVLGICGTVPITEPFLLRIWTTLPTGHRRKQRISQGEAIFGEDPIIGQVRRNIGKRKKLGGKRQTEGALVIEAMNMILTAREATVFLCDNCKLEKSARRSAGHQCVV
jgi:hypothetical protein